MGRQRPVVAFVPLWSLGPGMAGWVNGKDHVFKRAMKKGLHNV